MATENGRGFCKDCKKKVMLVRNKPSQVGHFVLTVLTLGLWGFVWAIAMLIPHPWRCQNCGAKCRKEFFG